MDFFQCWNLTVLGAGLDNVNGRYVQIRDFNGKRQFVKAEFEDDQKGGFSVTFPLQNRNSTDVCTHFVRA